MYLTTGLWSSQAYTEASKHIPAENLIEVANTKCNGYTDLTDTSLWNIDSEASYIHICVNETVDGFEITEENFPWELIPRDMVVVGDVSSNVATREINWKRFSVLYGGA
jgi:phosphoserine aminotransferase